MNKKFLSKINGFTLVEMMVAVSIFVIVALVISGTYITLADVFRKVQSNRAVIDNLNFAMDTMTLQIREGQSYIFEGTCSNGDSNCFSSISFDELIFQGDRQIKSRRIKYAFSLDNNSIVQCTAEYDEETGSGGQLPNLASCPDLTSKEITIKSLDIYKSNQSPERIRLVIDGIAYNKKGLESEFTLQTTLAQRNY